MPVKNDYSQLFRWILVPTLRTRIQSSIDFPLRFCIYMAVVHDSWPQTTFSVSERGFFHTRMPFGLCNSLLRLVDRVIGCDLELNVFEYLTRWHYNIEFHEKLFETLRKLSKRIKNAGLIISSEKSRLLMNKFWYLLMRKASKLSNST